METKHRIRVHRNVENAEIRPKPPVEHVSTVEPRSARVPKNQYVVVVVLVVVEWLYYCKRIIIVRWADLSDFFVDFRRKNVCFCFTSNENCLSSSRKRLHTKTGC